MFRPGSPSALGSVLHQDALTPKHPFLRRVEAGLVLGLILGALDSGLHVDVREWLAHPLPAVRGLTGVMGVYALALLLLSSVFRWPTLRNLTVVGFTLVQGLGWYYHQHPQMRLAQALGVLALSVLAAAGTARIFSWLLGGEVPRGRIGAPCMILIGIVGCAQCLGTVTQHAVDRVQTPITPATPESVRSRSGLPSVLVLTFDTLRPDHLGAYGYFRATTPNLDALSAEGVLFEHAQVQAPLTPVSHASIFTSRYPARHGIRGFSRYAEVLRARPTLAELLRESGYRTGAIVAAGPLAPGSGLETGFDTYDFTLAPDHYPFYGSRDTLLAKVLMRLQLVRDRWAYRGAREQTDRALMWLDSRDQRPFFLWVHYFDAHDPYAPPRRYLRLAAHPGASPLDRLRRSYLYDSEVMYLDHEVGRLVEGVRARGLLADTVIVGISDHGEGLGEHDYVGHSYRLFDEQLRGVFFLRFPALIPPGRRVVSQVRSVDVMPTLLDLLQLPVPQGAQGASLLPFIRGSHSERDLLSISETLEDPRGRLVSASDGRYKLIVSLNGRGEWLFDLKQDPLERREISSGHSDVVARLRKELIGYLREGTEVRNGDVPLDPAVRLNLRSLGYLN